MVRWRHTSSRHVDLNRILAKSEADEAWASLAQTWDIIPNGVWWFPLAPTTCAAVVAFKAAAFHVALGREWLRRTLAGRGVERVLHFSEFDHVPVAELPLAAAAFRYERRPGEGYWCDARAAHRGWLVYASHEDSVTLGGAWLVADAQHDWPNWSAHLWNGSAESYRPVAT